MPSDLSYWLISVPLPDGDRATVLDDVKKCTSSAVPAGSWEIPELKTGTLSGLLTLSDYLPKTDGSFTSTVSKLLDQLRSLVGDDKARLAQHARVNDRPVDDYLMPSGGWRWDRGRWGSDGKVHEVVEALTVEMNTIESSQKAKAQAYNLSKGALNSLQRKQQGNLSQRSLVDVVKKEHLVEGSEFMETLLVAVPINNVKDWKEKYERLSSMVVPRSSQEIASDNEFALMTVTIFKKIHDDFVHKARESRFIVRDFKWDDNALEDQKKELVRLEKEEKELWTELLKLTRINFSEAYQLLAHLKTIRLFVESVLRYGLPAEYAGVIVKPDPKTAVKTLKQLSGRYNYLASGKAKEKKGGTTDDVGEWATVMEQEYYDFVLFEIPKVEF